MKDGMECAKLYKDAILDCNKVVLSALRDAAVFAHSLGRGIKISWFLQPVPVKDTGETSAADLCFRVVISETLLVGPDRNEFIFTADEVRAMLAPFEKGEEND